MIRLTIGLRDFVQRRGLLFVHANFAQFAGKSIVAYYEGTEPPRHNPDRCPQDTQRQKYDLASRSVSESIHPSALQTKQFAHGSLTWKREQSSQRTFRPSYPNKREFFPCSHLEEALLSPKVRKLDTGKNRLQENKFSTTQETLPEQARPVPLTNEKPVDEDVQLLPADQRTMPSQNGAKFRFMETFSGDSSQNNGVKSRTPDAKVQAENNEVNRFFEELGPPTGAHQYTYDTQTVPVGPSDESSDPDTRTLLPTQARTLLSFENSGRSSPLQELHTIPTSSIEGQEHYVDWGAVFRANRDMKARAERERRVKEAEERVRLLQIEREIELVERGRAMERTQQQQEIRSILSLLQQRIFPSHPGLIQIEGQTVEQALGSMFQAGRAYGLLEAGSHQTPDVGAGPARLLSAPSEEGEIEEQLQ